MREQLRTLVDHAAQSAITIQVVPYDMGEHAGLDGRFTILSYPDPADPDIAYVEGTMGDIYLESAEDVAKHQLRFDQVGAAALSPEESAALIGKLARE